MALYFFQKLDTDSENESSSASVESKASGGDRGTKRSQPMIDSTNKQLKPS